VRFHFNFFKDLLGEYADEVFRPKMHRGIETDVPKGRGKKNRFYKGGSFHGFSGGGYKANIDYNQIRQFCIVKCSRRSEKILNKKHLAYIQKEGKGLNGVNPELYGADLDGYENRMKNVSYRWIISPDNPNVDLNILITELIRRVEFHTGFKLDWVATNHYNTAHPHAHILINGRDLKRNKVNFSQTFLKRTLRETCRDICTEMVGVRTMEERKESFQKQINGNYYTHLDKRLNIILSGTDRITFARLCNADGCTLLNNRLAYLQEVGLVKHDKTTNLYIFKNDWKEQLKKYSQYNTYLQGLQFLKVHPSQYAIHDIEKLGAVTGKVVKKYYMQENSNNHAIILETKPGYFLYVPLFEAPYKIPLGKNIKIEFQRLVIPNGGSRKTMNIKNIY